MSKAYELYITTWDFMPGLLEDQESRDPLRNCGKKFVAFGNSSKHSTYFSRIHFLFSLSQIRLRIILFESLVIFLRGNISNLFT